MVGRGIEEVQVDEVGKGGGGEWEEVGKRGGREGRRWEGELRR